MGLRFGVMGYIPQTDMEPQKVLYEAYNDLMGSSLVVDHGLEGSGFSGFGIQK